MIHRCCPHRKKPCLQCERGAPYTRHDKVTSLANSRQTRTVRLTKECKNETQVCCLADIDASLLRPSLRAGLALRCHQRQGRDIAGRTAAQILDLLGRDKTGTQGIANIGGKFNSSDAIVDHSVPMRRLVNGVAGLDCIWLTVEYGSVGHYQKKLEYRLVDKNWAQVKGANAERAPSAPPAAVR